MLVEVVHQDKEKTKELSPEKMTCPHACLNELKVLGPIIL